MDISWVAPRALYQNQLAEARTVIQTPRAGHSSLQEGRAGAISYNAGEEFQLALAFCLDQNGTVSLSASSGYLSFRGSQVKHSAGKTEPPSLKGFALQTEIKWITGLTLAWQLGTECSTGKCKPPGSRWVLQPLLNPWWETPCHGWPKASSGSGLPARGRLGTAGLGTL